MAGVIRIWVLAGLVACRHTLIVGQLSFTVVAVAASHVLRDLVVVNVLPADATVKRHACSHIRLILFQLTKAENDPLEAYAFGLASCVS